MTTTQNADITATVHQFLADLTERFGSVEAGTAAFLAWRAEQARA